MITVVEIADMQKAVGQAVILLSSNRSYFDAEIGLVIPRLIVAANARQILFTVDNEQRLLRSFSAFAFLTADCAFEWKHRRRTPGPGDISAGDNTWLTDYSWASEDDGKLLSEGIRQRFPGKGNSIAFHNDLPSYPEFRYVVHGERK